jgi:hypothetical protein
METSNEGGGKQHGEGSSGAGSSKKARRGTSAPRDEALAFLEEAMAEIQGPGMTAAAAAAAGGAPGEEL